MNLCAFLAATSVTSSAAAHPALWTLGQVVLWALLAVVFLLLALAGVMLLGIALGSEALVRAGGTALARCIYRVRVRGAERLPATGGVLLLPNHVTWIDALVLQLASPRPVRFLVFEPIYKQPLLHPVLKLFKCIPITPGRAKTGLSAAAEALRAGEVVCVYPEGELTRTGSLLRLRKGFEFLHRETGAPVVPVWLDQLWGSIFSFEGGKYFNKWPQRIPYPVTVAFGEPITGEAANTATVREKLLELGADCYEDRPLLQNQHLAEACLRGLKRGQNRVAVYDGNDGSQLKRGTLLAAGIALARLLRTGTTANQKRIAIVLPPGKGAMLANLGVVLAGKIPVNLNFTSGRTALESTIRRGGIETVLTARLVQKKLDNFPWTAVQQSLNLEEILPPLKPKIALWRLAVALLPWRVLAGLLSIPKRGGRDEAVLLFTSGSSGEPKGVVLSHRNILSNVSQFRLMAGFDPAKDKFLASLPFFHSFGCTVTLWFPLIEGVPNVTFPNPLDTAKNAELIEKYGCTILLATPTFLRGYLRKATREQLQTLRLVVVGAEKLPLTTAEAFEEKFGHPVLEGYGLTETSPVVAVNMHDVAVGKGRARYFQPARQLGSVGKMAPGLAAKITDPDTDAPRSIHETGMLWLRGANIFEGYFNDPEATAKVKTPDGWFRTGDLGRLDEDGFLHIEGRVSRFSKIAGEMVPHETVETKIAEALALPTDGERQLVVVGVPDLAKGEALVLLTTVEIDKYDALAGRAAALGVANLWIPKTIKRVEALPVLGTGKLDLKGCKDLALAGAEPEK